MRPPFFLSRRGDVVTADQELREKLIACAGELADYAVDRRVADADECKALAESACALTEAVAYLAPVPGERRLSGEARGLLVLSLRRAWRDLDYPEIAKELGAHEECTKRALDELEGLR
jgi:hypothetical protein